MPNLWLLILAFGSLCRRVDESLEVYPHEGKHRNTISNEVFDTGCQTSSALEIDLGAKPIELRSHPLHDFGVMSRRRNRAMATIGKGDETDVGPEEEHVRRSCPADGFLISIADRDQSGQRASHQQCRSAG